MPNRCDALELYKYWVSAYCETESACNNESNENIIPYSRRWQQWYTEVIFQIIVKYLHKIKLKTIAETEVLGGSRKTQLATKPLV